MTKGRAQEIKVKDVINLTIELVEKGVSSTFLAMREQGNRKNES